MRTVGALVAGMFAGLLAGVLLAEPVVWLLLGDGAEPGYGVLLLLGSAPPVLAGVGAAVGVLIERRTRDRIG